MKFAIFREIEESGKKRRKFLIEWDKTQIADALEKELPGGRDALDRVIEQFKKKSVRIP
jgi:hypothetical protein